MGVSWAGPRRGGCGLAGAGLSSEAARGRGIGTVGGAGRDLLAAGLAAGGIAGWG